jgi:hypothetical protein
MDVWRIWLLGTAAAFLLVGPAGAQSGPSPAVRFGPGESLQLDLIVVSAQQLDAARSQIQPSLGATVYGFSASALAAIPGGDHRSRW